MFDWKKTGGFTQRGGSASVVCTVLALVFVQGKSLALVADCGEALGRFCLT